MKKLLLLLFFISETVLAGPSPWIYGSGGPQSLQPLTDGVCKSISNVLTCGLTPATVSSVSSGDGSIDVTNPTTTPDIRVHWPMTAGVAGSAAAPAITWGGSGIYQSSFGLLNFSTAGVERLRLENNGTVVIGPGGSGTLQVNGDGQFTGNISAANYPPTNSANSLARFDNSGVLNSSLWSIDPDYSSLTSLISPAATTISDYWQIRTQTNLSSTVTNLTRELWLSLQSVGTTSGLVGVQFDFGVPVTNDATLMNIGSSSSTSVGGNLHGLDIGIDSPTVGSFILSNAGTTNIIGGDYTGYYLNAGNTIAGNTTLYSGNFYGSSGNDLSLININSNGNAGNNFRGSSLNNNGTVSQFASGYSVSQGGVVTKGYDAFEAAVFANVGDGSGVNLNFLNASTNSGITIDGGLYLVNLNNQANVTNQIFGTSINNSGQYAGMTGLYVNNSGTMIGNNNFYGTSITNSSPAYTFVGSNYNNSGPLTEMFEGINVYDNGGARTATGASIILQGTYAQDARGLKVDVSGATSTTQVIQGLEVNGGKQTIVGSYKPPSAGFVDIGSYFSQNATIDLGSPLTGTDMFEQFFQSNFIVHDDVALGPLSLGVNLLGVIHQIEIDSGKTVPMLRSLLVGTSIPGGSGGTVTEHHVLGIVGLPSFGGSVINPTRVGIIDEAILGQNFCDGATDCWFIKNQDVNSQNSLARLAVGEPITESNVKLSIKDGHINSKQTTQPTATPDANAGTGGTCTVTGTDSDFTVELTEGSGAWASGSQCVVSFNMTYNNAPTCTFSANNNNSAIANMTTYQSKSTSGWGVNFINPDTAANVYQWDVHCEGTNE